MSFFIVKLILGTILFLSGVLATLTMLILMGRIEKKTSPTTLRKFHKFFGFIFFTLLLVLAFLGMRHWAFTGDNASTRAVLHGILALALLITLLTKVAIARFFKQFMKMVPTLGLIVFCLSFVVFVISGIFYILREYASPPTAGITEIRSEAQIQGRIEEGKKTFDRLCWTCHSPNSEEKRTGPSLMGVLKKATLPHSGKPATEENIKQQLLHPARAMPTFRNFTDQELSDLLAYLESI